MREGTFVRGGDRHPLGAVDGGAAADRHLKPGGTFLIKLFQGVGFDDYVRQLRRRYAKVAIRKPAASRKRSPEVYALAQGKLPGSPAA